MTLFSRNFIVSASLAISDFVSLTCSIYIASALLLFVTSNKAPLQNIDEWVLLHTILSVICIAWFSIRLRHYFYRKTFWFELKEILRTLVIFSVIEIAVMTFATWSFSRVLWVITWSSILLFVPLLRMLTKKILDTLDLWKRDTWIIGNGVNAIEAYKAISSENNLGLVVVGFISSNSDNNPAVDNINNVPVLQKNVSWLDTIDNKTQFIVAVEAHESEIRNRWLRSFMIKGYRYVSVIPTLRGMPLDSTDMSFIFSH
ncbi:undecaprenyl-phosphate galactose phosphotransferase WbaP, partial [Klebsiella pneumoniae]|nr:undecaprenyl-phosphate galactose phosphotransferase WbaP [Klebsiella pneumoniae]